MRVSFILHYVVDYVNKQAITVRCYIQYIAIY